MDRNGIVVHLSVLLMMVALRKESVDRNNGRLRAVQNAQMSLSARRAWIEMVWKLMVYPMTYGRSPQGERG